MFTDHTYLYTDIHKSIARHTKLHEYNTSMAKDFLIFHQTDQLDKTIIFILTYVIISYVMISTKVCYSMIYQ